MKMKDLKTDYRNGSIAKSKYIEAMHEIHEVLFEYSEIIKDTDIEKIEITSNGIVMTSKINGLKMLCDNTDLRSIPIEIINFGSYEKNESKFILQMINKESVVFDIGANAGWISLFIAKNIESANIFSFEPLPKTFEYLRANKAENNMSNVHPFNFGFSDEAKTLKFFYYPQGAGNSSIRNLSNRADVQEIECVVSTLDNYTKENDIYPDFIKCDVEGAELFVFKGGFETIRKCTPVVYRSEERRVGKE